MVNYIELMFEYSIRQDEKYEEIISDSRYERRSNLRFIFEHCVFVNEENRFKIIDFMAIVHETCKGRWGVDRQGDGDHGGTFFYFEDEEDAVMFRMLI